MASSRVALVCAVATLAFVQVMGAAPVPTLLGNITIGAPGFLGLVPLSSSNASDLVITSFTGSPFSTGNIHSIQNVGQYLANPSAAPITTLMASANWPNNFTVPPAGMFTGVEFGLLVADGFLVPGKDAGSIYLIPYVNGQAQTPVVLSNPKASYFYHNVELIDINQDGFLDILTARATKSIFSAGNGELLWLQNPGANNLQGPWNETVITAGPDVQFSSKQLFGAGSKTLEVVAAQFFTNSLSIYQIQLGSGALLSSAVIDDTIGPAYAASFTDLNADGVQELLVTNHAASVDDSGVFVYTIPAQPLTAKWGKTQIAAGFPITEGGFNQAAPGFAYVVKLHVDDKEPSILVAGDGSQSAYLLQRDDQYPATFVYRQSVIVDLAGTVGSLAAGDVDGDGWLEVFIPSYDGSLITVWTFKPAAKEDQPQPEREEDVRMEGEGIALA